MKTRNLFTAVILIALLSVTAWGNGLSLNSVGPRALGMGGAFVGLANDGTAVYWNPAGLAGQANAVTVYYTGIMPSANYSMDLASIDASTNTKIYMAPGLFANYAMDKWTFALGIYVPAGLGTDWNAEDIYGPDAEGKDLMSQIGVISISPSVAYQVNDQLSLGMSVNIYYAMFDLAQPADGGVLGMYQFEESSTGTGVGVTLGLKYKFSEMLAAGFTFRTSTKVTMEGDASNTMFPNLPDSPPYAPGPEESAFSRDVTWPMWIGAGIAFKPKDCLTLTFDVQYSKWSELDKLVADYDDAYWKQVMEAGGDNEFDMQWEDAIQIRTGLEYTGLKDMALRIGYYYDPAPAPDETVNVLFPSSTNHVATAGFGYYKEKFGFEAGLEYLFGAERDIEMTAENAMPGLHQMDVFAFSLGFTFNL